MKRKEKNFFRVISIILSVVFLITTSSVSFAKKDSKEEQLNHIDVYVNGSISIETQINGVSQGVQTGVIKMSNVSAIIVDNGTTRTYNNFSTQTQAGSTEMEFHKDVNSFSKSAEITIKGTMECAELGINTTFSKTFSGTGITAAVQECPLHSGCDFRITEDEVMNTVTHDVVFKTVQGGKIDGDTADIVYNNIIDGSEFPSIPTTSANECYEFEGWYDENENLVENFPSKVTQDSVFIAKWKQLATPTPVVTPEPTKEPTPTPSPTAEPTKEPTPTPSTTLEPTKEPTSTPSPTPESTKEPTPTLSPTPEPTKEPTPTPSVTPEPTKEPTSTPTARPEPSRTSNPGPVIIPTKVPTPGPTITPVVIPTSMPTPEPTKEPMQTVAPTSVPTPEPTKTPEPTPVATPTSVPTLEPTKVPTPAVTPTLEPTLTLEPDKIPDDKPILQPTPIVTEEPQLTPEPTETQISTETPVPTEIPDTSVRVDEDEVPISQPSVEPKQTVKPDKDKENKTQNNSQSKVDETAQNYVPRTGQSNVLESNMWVLIVSSIGILSILVIDRKKRRES